MPRAQLAAETLGDAHGLDNGTGVASLVLTALRQPLPDDRDAPLPAYPADERARDVWARAGVPVNELARPALVLNLAPAGQHHCPSGEPAYMSLRMLVRSTPKFAGPGATVYVCENPNIVAIAADRLGMRCKPLVCTEGMPAAAQRTVLTALAAAGTILLYHGDFDWPGVGIANHVVNTFRARPWLMGTADYLQAARTLTPPHRSLDGSPVEPCWDAALAAAMKDHGMAIPEEAVVGPLLADLDLDCGA